MTFVNYKNPAKPAIWQTNGVRSLSVHMLVSPKRLLKFCEKKLNGGPISDLDVIMAASSSNLNTLLYKELIARVILVFNADNV